VAFVFSTLGMLAGHWLAGARSSVPPPPAPAVVEGALSVPSFALVDPEGRRRVLMATSREGNPAIWFFDRNGKALGELRAIVARSPGDAGAKAWLESYTAAYSFAPGEFP
jgi:hypothetical protein